MWQNWIGLWALLFDWLFLVVAFRTGEMMQQKSWTQSGKYAPNHRQTNQVCDLLDSSLRFSSCRSWRISNSWFPLRWVCEDFPELKLAVENYILVNFDSTRYVFFCKHFYENTDVSLIISCKFDYQVPLYWQSFWVSSSPLNTSRSCLSAMKACVNSVNAITEQSMAFYS